MTIQVPRVQGILRWPALEAAVAAVVSTTVAVLLIPMLTPTIYARALTVSLAAGATVVAVVDFRTHLLPNRHVAALAGAGLIQAAAVAVASHDGVRFLNAGIAAMAVCAAYLLLGLIGWFGFGDAKFAGALTVTVAIYAGLSAMYILPLAILYAAVGRLLCRVCGKSGGRHAHGPAIAIAAVCVMAAAVLLSPPVA